MVAGLCFFFLLEVLLCLLSVSVVVCLFCLILAACLFAGRYWGSLFGDRVFVRYVVLAGVFLLGCVVVSPLGGGLLGA